MKTILSVLFIFLALFFLCNCAPAMVNQNRNTVYSKKTPVTVNSSYKKPLPTIRDGPTSGKTVILNVYLHVAGLEEENSETAQAEETPPAASEIAALGEEEDSDDAFDEAEDDIPPAKAEKPKPDKAVKSAIREKESVKATDNVKPGLIRTSIEVVKNIYNRWVDLIKLAAKTYDLDPSVIGAVMIVESRGDPAAVSPKGAMGLMQLMPETAGDMGVDDPFDPRKNILGGAKYLKWLKVRLSNEAHVLAAYNQGEGGVSQFIREGGDPNKLAYVRRVRFFHKLLNQSS